MCIDVICGHFNVFLRSVRCNWHEHTLYGLGNVCVHCTVSYSCVTSLTSVNMYSCIHLVCR